jgi:hypothetical protein
MMVDVKNNVLKTRKLIICNIVPFMPFILLFLYFADSLIKSSQT